MGGLDRCVHAENVAFKADNLNNKLRIKLLNVVQWETHIGVFWLKCSAMGGTDR